MREFAPKKLHPSDAELAAYIDGALDEQEAALVTEHLALCESCYEVYSETLQFQLDSETESDVENGAPFQPQLKAPPPISMPASSARPISAAETIPVPTFANENRPRQWFSIAAVLIMGVGVGAYYQLYAPLALMPDNVAKPVSSRPGVVKDLWIGPVYRGDGGDEEMNLNEASFRTGVQLVNLQVSLQAEERGQAQDAIAAILKLLKTGLITEDLEKKYTSLTGALDKSPKTPSSFLPQASELAKETREVFLADEDLSLDLGQWVAAGRLAAIAKNPAFFKESENRSFLRRALWREKLGFGEMKLDPETRESLQQIADIIAKDDLGASDYVELKRRFEQILEIHYPVS
jgi:hypothetical protein